MIIIVLTFFVTFFIQTNKLKCFYDQSKVTVYIFLISKKTKFNTFIIFYVTDFSVSESRVLERRHSDVEHQREGLRLIHRIAQAEKVSSHFGGKVNFRFGKNKQSLYSFLPLLSRSLLFYFLVNERYLIKVCHC